VQLTAFEDIAAPIEAVSAMITTKSTHAIAEA